MGQRDEERPSTTLWTRCAFECNRHKTCPLAAGRSSVSIGVVVAQARSVAPCRIMSRFPCEWDRHSGTSGSPKCEFCYHVGAILRIGLRIACPGKKSGCQCGRRSPPPPFSARFWFTAGTPETASWGGELGEQTRNGSAPVAILAASAVHRRGTWTRSAFER